MKFGNFYPKVEKIILDTCKNFLESLKGILKPQVFEVFANLYFSQLKSVFPKCTQRKLEELMNSKIIEV